MSSSRYSPALYSHLSESGSGLQSQSKSGKCVHFLVNLSGKNGRHSSARLSGLQLHGKYNPRSNPLNLGRCTNAGWVGGGEHSGQQYWKQMLCDTHCLVVKCLISSASCEKKKKVLLSTFGHLIFVAMFGRNKLNRRIIAAAVRIIPSSLFFSVQPLRRWGNVLSAHYWIFQLI